MTKLPDKITITITPQDAKKAKGYCDCWYCLLGTAARRQFEIPDGPGLSCGAQTMSFTECAEYQRYQIREHKKLVRCYGKRLKPTVKKPFKVHLTKINA
jgi:hypothetical protein